MADKNNLPQDLAAVANRALAKIGCKYRVSNLSTDTGDLADMVRSAIYTAIAEVQSEFRWPELRSFALIQTPVSLPAGDAWDSILNVFLTWSDGVSGWATAADITKVVVSGYTGNFAFLNGDYEWDAGKTALYAAGGSERIRQTATGWAVEQRLLADWSTIPVSKIVTGWQVPPPDGWTPIVEGAVAAASFKTYRGAAYISDFSSWNGYALGETDTTVLCPQPSDFLRPLDADGAAYELVGGYFTCPLGSTLSLHYIRYSEDPAEWSPQLLKCIYYRLAMELCLPVLQTDALSRGLVEEYERLVFPQAKRVSSYNRRSTQIRESGRSNYARLRGGGRA